MMPTAAPPAARLAFINDPKSMPNPAAKNMKAHCTSCVIHNHCQLILALLTMNVSIQIANTINRPMIAPQISTTAVAPDSHRAHTARNSSTANLRRSECNRARPTVAAAAEVPWPPGWFRSPTRPRARAIASSQPRRRRPPTIWLGARSRRSSKSIRVVAQSPTSASSALSWLRRSIWARPTAG